MSFCPWPHEEPCTILSIGDLEAVSSGAEIGHGLVSIDGWEGGAPAVGGPVPFESADDAIRGDVYYGPRSLIIEGDTFAGSHAELAEMLGDLSTLGRYETLTMDETVHLGLVRRMDVTRLRPVQITMQSPTWATWTLALESVGWRRLDVDAQSAVITTGGTALANTGTAPTQISFNLNGPLTNPGLSWPGGAWQFSGTVAAGQSLVVDMDQRRVQDPKTTTQYRRLASGSWLALPPGTTTVKRTGTGSGTITAKWRSAWS